MPRPILVIGATGRIGRYVVDELARLNVPVRALAREPTQARLPEVVDVVPGDLTAPESLDDALRDVGAVFLLWAAPIAAAAGAIDRFAAASSRVVLLSAPFRTPHPFFQQPNGMRDVLAEVERLLATAGLATTILRPGMLASNARDWWGQQIRDGDVVRWPYASVETAPIDERDVAAVAAHALLNDLHVGGDYVLTGRESLSQAAQVNAIGHAISRAVRLEELTPDEFRRETAARWPPAVVEMLLAAWGAAVGLPAFVTSTVGEITGTPARTFREWAVDNAAAFRRDDDSDRRPATRV